MCHFKFSPLARDDLNDIWEFIAQDNPYAANRLTDLIEQKCYFPIIFLVRRSGYTNYQDGILERILFE